MKHIRLPIILSLGFILTGCGLPVHKNEPSARITKLQTSGMQSPQICLNGKAFQLSTTADVAEIPAGNPIGIASAFSTGDGQVSYSCRPTIVFTPQENIGYVGVLLFRDNRCYLQILREDPSTPTGLAWEPSVRRGGC